MASLTRHSHRSGRFRAKRAILYGLMLVVLIAILAPFAWLLISSVSRPVDLLDKPLRFFPSEISLDRYAALTIGADADPAAEGFRAALLNSLTIATVVTGRSSSRRATSSGADQGGSPHPPRGRFVARNRARATP